VLLPATKQNTMKVISLDNLFFIRPLIQLTIESKLPIHFNAKLIEAESLKVAFFFETSKYNFG
jgi:hypothetical protein